MIKPEDVQKHIDGIAMPYYKKLAAGHLLTQGVKEVIDHRGDRVSVRGSMYKGALTGYGEYTDKAGNEWKAWFNNDLKHGLCIIKHAGCNTVQISTSFNGQYHGFLTFWLDKGSRENVRY